MTIVFITTMAGAPWGGSELLWSEMAEEALSLQHKVVVSILDWGALPEKIVNLQKKGAIIHKRIRFQFNDIPKKVKGKIIEKFITPFQLQSLIKNNKPDVLFISMGAFCDFEIDVYRNFIDKCILPIYVVVHSDRENAPLAYYNITNVRQTCLKVNKLFFVSNRLRKIAERKTLTYFPNSEIILNPVNMKFFNYVNYPKMKSLQMALVASLDVNTKGQSFLIQILSNNKWKKRDWVLNIFGEGKDKNLIQDTINFYKLEDKVFLKGYVTDIREDIWKNNHVLLMPSYHEGLPIALVEAMLCGRTAVVTDVGGCAEVVNDNVTGFIAEAATLFSFDKALERMWENKNNLSQMGRAAHNEMQERVSINPSKIALEKILH